MKEKLNEFDEKRKTFVGTRTATSESLELIYIRKCILHVFKHNPGHPIFFGMFLRKFIRLTEYSQPDILDDLRAVLLNRLMIESETVAKQVGDFSPDIPYSLDMSELTTQAPITTQLISEVIFQLTLIACSMGETPKSSESHIINGLVPNPSLALWILDLFLHLTSSSAQSNSAEQADTFKSLRRHFFSPPILSLVFQAVVVSSDEIRLAFVRMLGTLIISWNKEGKLAELNLNEERLRVLKQLMITLYSQQSAGKYTNFFRALVEVNASIEEVMKQLAALKFEDVGNETKQVQAVVQDDYVDIEYAENFWPFCLYGFPGDTNGLLHFLGTRMGTVEEWENPAEEGSKRTVQIFSSRATSVETFVSRKVQRSKHALDGSADNPPWYIVDFGEWYISPYCYTLTSGADGDCWPISWVIEGYDAATGGKWAVLANHKNCTVFDRAKQAVCFPIIMKPGRFYFNKLRVKLTGMTSQGSWTMLLSGFDVYGAVQRIPRPTVYGNSDEDAKTKSVKVIANPGWFEDVMTFQKSVAFFAGEAESLPTEFSRNIWADHYESSNVQNVARGRPTRQSSDYSSSSLASNAIDGYTKHVTSTTSRTAVESKPWWEVDLGQNLTISKIFIRGFKSDDEKSDQDDDFF